MTKQLLRQIDPHVALYRDPKTGLAWIEDGHTGLGHSCHPNIDESGSIRGMKAQGYWGKKDRCVRSHGFIYNIDHYVESDALDKVAAAACQCSGVHA